MKIWVLDLRAVGDKEMETPEATLRVRGRERTEGSVKAEVFVERERGPFEKQGSGGIVRMLGVPVLGVEKVNVELKQFARGTWKPQAILSPFIRHEQLLED